MIDFMFQVFYFVKSSTFNTHNLNYNYTIKYKTICIYFIITIF